MKEAIGEAKPYLRTLIAVAFKLRYSWTVNDCYKVADAFVKTLEEDIKEE